jgi:predicted restriction endonuclease
MAWHLPLNDTHSRSRTTTATTADLETEDAAFWAHLDMYCNGGQPGTAGQFHVQPHQRQSRNSESAVRSLKTRDESAESWFERKAREWSGLGSQQLRMQIPMPSHHEQSTNQASSTWPSASKQSKRYRGNSSDKLVAAEALSSSAKTQKIGSSVVVMVDDYFNNALSITDQDAASQSQEQTKDQDLDKSPGQESPKSRRTFLGRLTGRVRTISRPRSTDGNASV